MSAHPPPGYCTCADCICDRFLALDDATLEHGGVELRARCAAEARGRLEKLAAERARVEAFLAKVGGYT